MQTVLHRLHRTLRALSRDRRGNVAMIFALAFIPMIAAVGAAVDYSRANSARTAMLAAIDSTALILSKDAQTMTADQLKARAMSVFLANFHRSEVSGVTVTPTFTTPQQGSFTLTIAASGSVPTTVTGLWQPTTPIAATGQVVWA